MSPLSQTISLNLFNCAFDINLGPSSWKRCDAVVKTSKKSFCIDVGSPVSIRGHPHEQAWVYQTAHVLQLFGASGFVWPNLATISCKVFDRRSFNFHVTRKPVLLLLSLRAASKYVAGNLGFFYCCSSNVLCKWASKPWAPESYLLLRKIRLKTMSHIWWGRHSFC